MNYTVYTPENLLPRTNNTISYTVKTRQEAAELAKLFSRESGKAVEVTRQPKPFSTKIYYLVF